MSIDTQQSLTRLFTGSYEYTRAKKVYAEENFEISQDPETNVYTYFSRFLSRLPSGQFLKINCSYETYENHVVKEVNIHRDLGDKKCHERFSFNQNSATLEYLYLDEKQKEQFQRGMANRFIIITPNFLTKTLFNHFRKFDTSARTPYLILKSPNEWSYIEQPVEKFLYATFKTAKMKPYLVGHDEYTVMPADIYFSDNWDSDKDKHPPIKCIISKEMSIPFYAELSGNVKIQIKTLRRHLRPEETFGI